MCGRLNNATRTKDKSIERAQSVAPKYENRKTLDMKVIAVGVINWLVSENIWLKVFAIFGGL